MARQRIGAMGLKIFKKDLYFAILSLLFILVFTNFAGAAWVDADGSGQESINVSNNSGYSQWPSLYLDIYGNPHIAWYDETSENWEVYYLRWKGTAWVDADGSGTESIRISSLESISPGPSLCLDSNNRPHIAWRHDRNNIDYLKWNGTTWVGADGSGQESINIGGYDPTSLCLDSNNYPHIAWMNVPFESQYWDVYYLKWSGTTWVDADGSGQESINVSNNFTGNCGHPSLSLDTSGNPHIAWWDDTSGNSEIYYLKWNGTAWVDADGFGQESINVSNTSSSSYEFQWPSLCLDSNNYPHIAWDDDASGNSEIYYLRWNGTAWVDADGSGIESINISNNSKDNRSPSLYLDASGNPHIAWENYTDSEIYYLQWTGSAWVDADGSGQESINVSNNSRFSECPSLCLDTSGDPHIAWHDASGGGHSEIYYLKWSGIPYYVKGFVEDSGGTGISGVTVTLSGDSFGSYNTLSDGYYEFLGLAPGNYTVTASKPGWNFSPVEYVYSSLDSDQSNQNFIGTASPVLEVTPSSLDFGEVPIGETRVKAFTISNSGGGTLNGTITTNREWISVNPVSFDSNYVTVSVTVYPNNMNVWMTYTGTVTVDSNGGVKTVTVSIVPTCVKTYPNPYSLSSGKPLTFWGTGVPYATIKIYTLNGELVKTLKETKGEDKITWDGRNEDGDRIVRGIYFFTTKNPKERNTGKFTVVR